MQLTNWVHESIWISKVKVIHWTKVTQIQHFQTSFPEKLLSQLKPNLMWILHGMEKWKFCSNGSGHMTKVVATLIYGKNMKNSSSLEPKSRWPWKLICSIGYLSTTKIVQMMTMGWPWPSLWQSQILSFMLLYGKKVKQWIFQKLL